MPADYNPGKTQYEYYPLDWISTDVDPIVVQNFWYTPLPTTGNVKAYYLVVEQTNNGAANETLEVRLTINGVVFAVYTLAFVSGTPRYLFFTLDGVLNSGVNLIQLLSPGEGDQSAPLETKSLLVEVRQTTPVDVVAANIEVNMVMATLT